MLLTQITDSGQKTQTCREITVLLPDWFGLSKANEKYAEGIKEATVFAAYENNDSLIGLMALKMPFPNNADIYWMGIKPRFHRQGVGKALLQMAEAFAQRQHCHTLTVETLSLSHNDPNYQKTYRFYTAMGFVPLFELEPYDSKHRMCYLIKQLE